MKPESVARGQLCQAVHDDEPSHSDKLDRNVRRAAIFRPLCGLELELELELELRKGTTLNGNICRRARRKMIKLCMHVTAACWNCVGSVGCVLKSSMITSYKKEEKIYE